MISPRLSRHSLSGDTGVHSTVDEFPYKQVVRRNLNNLAQCDYVHVDGLRYICSFPACPADDPVDHTHGGHAKGLAEARGVQ